MSNKKNDSWDDLDFSVEKGKKIGTPRIRITEQSTFLYNAGFCFNAKLEDETYVRLGYSPKNNAIVFDFTKDPLAPNAYKVVSRGSSATTTSRTFFHTHHLDSKKLRGQYTPQEMKIPKVGDVWVIKLDEKISR